MFKTSIQQIISIGKKSIGLLLFIVCGIAIYNKVLVDEHWKQYQIVLANQLNAVPFYDWVVLLILMGVNYFMESVKWKMVLANHHPISISKSIQSIFVGQAFAFFTPNRIGEFVGRTLHLTEGKKMMGMAQMAWTSYAQLLVTICFGAFAINFSRADFHLGQWYKWIQLLSPFIVLIALFVFFYKKQWSGRLAFLNIIQIDNKVKWKLALLSMARYFVFMFQYIWVASILHMQIDASVLIISIAILFICLSILPTISITELVVRGQLLLLLLAPFYSDKMMVIGLSSLIWVVNFLLPAIIGTFLLLGYRLKR